MSPDHGSQSRNTFAEPIPRPPFLMVSLNWPIEHGLWDPGLAKKLRAPQYDPVLLVQHPARHLSSAPWCLRSDQSLGAHRASSVNSNLPLARVRTLDEICATSTAQTSFAMLILAIAGCVALLLGVVGIYGVIAYVATQRTREIGIRMALGAQSEDVRRLFLRHGLLLTVAGISMGIVFTLALTRVTSTLLFGVSPMDPPTYAAVCIGLGGVALLATWLPASRASRVDPVVALRAGM